MRVSAKLLGVGLALTLGGGGGFISCVSHQLSGQTATATLLERNSKCQVEYELLGDFKRTKVDLGCDEAVAFQKRIGADKIKIDRRDYVRMSYVDLDGEGHEANVDADAAPHNAASGAQFPVVYNPAHLDDVRRPLDWRVAAILFATGAFGLIALWVGYVGILDPDPAPVDPHRLSVEPSRPNPPPRQATARATSFGRRNAA